MNPFSKFLSPLSSLFQRQPRVILYFSPHQDDELLTLGIDGCRMLQKGYEIHVILCSDGSKSGIRKKLADGKSCPHHPGIHEYDLDIPAFIAARDLEFRESCAGLGYETGHVHISAIRAVDGELSVQQGEAILRETLSRFPGDVSVRTISPFGGKKQHKDHTHLGQAAMNLYQKGLIKDLRLFIEPYCLESCREAYPQLKLTTIRADGAVTAALKKAIAAYSLWAPREGRYAIGYHSVTTVFKDFLAAPAAYCHQPQKKQ